MKRCYWKTVSESPSQEGKVFREEHPEIEFNKCRYRCSGYQEHGSCEHYELLELPDELIGRLEDLEGVVG